MAGVHRHVAHPGLSVLIALGGCGAPISNAPFLEEPRFLDALLDQTDVAPPEALDALAASDGDAPLLDAALGSLDTYRDLVVFPVAICDHLRTIGPSRRTGQRRAWAPSALTVPVGQGLQTMWIQADVVRLAEEQFEVRVDVAASETAPPRTAGAALVDGDVASWRWELDAVAERLGMDVELETLGFTIDPAGGDEGRRVEVGYGTPPAFDAYWVLDGERTFAFTGRFSVTADERSWPGQLAVAHGPDGGGAQGEVDVAGERLPFAACWAADGAPIWQGGADPRILTAGDPSACPSL